MGYLGILGGAWGILDPWPCTVANVPQKFMLEHRSIGCASKPRKEQFYTCLLFVSADAQASEQACVLTRVMAVCLWLFHSANESKETILGLHCLRTVNAPTTGGGHALSMFLHWNGTSHALCGAKSRADFSVRIVELRIRLNLQWGSDSWDRQVMILTKWKQFEAEASLENMGKLSWCSYQVGVLAFLVATHHRFPKN